jgi:protein TonB
MNTLQQAPLPRQFATGSLIAIAHLVVFGLIILNPVERFQHKPKETIVMMVSSTLPQPKVRIAKLEKTPPVRNIITPVIPQIAVKSDIENAIQVAPAVADIPAPVTPTPVTHIPTIAKAEPAGPKLVSAVEYIQAPQADYPAIARRLGEEGRVVMQVLVNDKGRAEKVEILKSSGFARLDESAKLALLRALFKPYVEDGKATMVLATASINFSLRG